MTSQNKLAWLPLASFFGHFNSSLILGGKTEV